MLSDFQNVIVLDLETTGLDHRTERIIEIGAVRLENGEVTEIFESLVNPEVPIRHSSYQVHGISEDMVKDAPKIEEILPQILEFMGDLPFVAHNAIFDYSFLNEASKRVLDKRLKNLRIDTYDMFKTVFPEEVSHGLSAMLAKFGYASDVKHRALDDAKNLALVYPKILALFEQQMAWKLSQLGNVQYLVERYQRTQKTIQLLQAELNDLREVFKLHFQQGGKPVMTSNGDLMVSSYKRNYEYNEAELKRIIKAAGLEGQCFKLNTRAIDRLIEKTEIDEDVRSAIKDARTQITENRIISFIKPADPEEAKAYEETDTENGKEELAVEAPEPA